jgi:hypothetical protein
VYSAGEGDPFFGPLAGYVNDLQARYDAGNEGTLYILPRPPTCGPCAPPQ